MATYAVKLCFRGDVFILKDEVIVKSPYGRSDARHSRAFQMLRSQNGKFLRGKSLKEILESFWNLEESMKVMGLPSAMFSEWRKQMVAAYAEDLAEEKVRKSHPTPIRKSNLTTLAPLERFFLTANV